MRVSRLIVASLVVVGASAGCSAPEVPLPGQAVSVVVSARANSVPVPVGGVAALQQVVAGSVQQRALVSVVSTDGQPRVTGSVQLQNTAHNDQTIGKQDAANTATVMSMITDSSAVVGQANPLQAIALAAAGLQASPGAKTLVVIDSGLQTVAPLRFEDGLLNPGTDPNEVAASVSAQHAEPDLTGVDVVWLSLGQTVGPQSPLTTPASTLLQQIWQAVLDTGHPASVRFVNTGLPATGTVPADAPPVTAVPVPALQSAVGGAETGLPSTGSAEIGDGQAPPPPLTVSFPATTLGFLADQAVLADPTQAASVIASTAEKLKSARYTRISVMGTTADVGDLAGQITLARARAGVLRDLLVAAGVPAESFTVVDGVGSQFPGFIPDRDPDGTLNETLAAQNRLVIITAAS